MITAKDKSQENQIELNQSLIKSISDAMSDDISGATAKSHIDKDKNNKPYEQSNFDIIIWDRKFYDVEHFTAENKKFNKNNKAMLWHAMFGHASLA